MAQLPDITTVGTVLIIAAAALGLLGTLASAIRHQVMLEDLKARADRLRIQYRKRLADSEERKIIEVGEVRSAEPKAATKAAA
jgi:hypothetical protein